MSVPVYELTLRLQGQEVHFHTTLGWAVYTEERVEFVGLDSMEEGIRHYFDDLVFVPAYNLVGNEASTEQARSEVKGIVDTLITKLNANLDNVHRTYNKQVEGDLPKYEEIRIGITPYQVIAKLRQSGTVDYE